MPAIDCHEEFDSTQTQSRWLRGVDPGFPGGEPALDRMQLRARQAEFLAKRQQTVLAIMGELVGPSDLHHAVSKFVDTLAEQFDAARVAWAFVADDDTLEIAAISGLAATQLASNEHRVILNAMEECLKREALVRIPSSEAGCDSLIGHQVHVKLREDMSVVAVPCYRNTEPVGVLLLQRDNLDPFEDASVELLEHLVVVATPALSFWREAQSGALSRVAKQWNRALENRFGSGRFGSRFLLALFLGIVVTTTLVPFQSKVSADAELVPQDRRFVIAPFDGFIDELSVEPGDSVAAGQLLAQLEQRELELESARRDSDLAGAESDFRLAMASHDRQATAVARANLDRERAMRDLVDQRLDRVELRAPIAGLIINSDSADTIGAPVRRGEALFEIAQAEGYEVHILVHERDIREIYVGQRGTLSLRARPEKKLDVTVHTIHPVAESSEGVSRFRIRATLEAPSDISPRPGESGIAKLELASTNLLYLFGRPIVQQLTELRWRFL